jgi:uncharacterized FAD-dependent dehydrogenase
MSKTEFLEIFGDLGHSIMNFIEDLKPILNFGENYVFFAPEIKESPKKVKTTKYFETDVKDVYVYGDVLNTRGIVPAATEGIRAVQHLLSNV